MITTVTNFLLTGMILQVDIQGHRNWGLPYLNPPQKKNTYLKHREHLSFGMVAWMLIGTELFVLTFCLNKLRECEQIR